MSTRQTIKKVAYLPGYWMLEPVNDISPSSAKTDMPDADIAATRQLLCEIGFREPIFELNGHDPQSVRQLVDYLAALSEQEEEAGEKTYHS
ncbi:ethanolamine utilization protein [Salmonella enterica subsp. arizonae]|uniref:Ethanolamine utilization protein n=1 Tax=Salmonella enterica subsp. arizonae TaxID=59203 RepID=A0A379T8M0_SALER|nr:ethanolamine utilization protein [Salmonella enterica subsp. arizonae]